MKKISSSKTALHLAVSMALTLVPLTSSAIVNTQGGLENGGWISNITGSVASVAHIYTGSTGALLNHGSNFSSPGTLSSLTINVGTVGADGTSGTIATLQSNLSGIFLDAVPTSANKTFMLDGNLTINVNQGSYIQ
ncbi:MAG: hypothetical protein LUC43_00745, partial [Burkholderiales bacterium]|nr:hypothetical protein [Burkholderiales bacterium]